MRRTPAMLVSRICALTSLAFRRFAPWRFAPWRLALLKSAPDRLSPLLTNEPISSEGLVFMGRLWGGKCGSPVPEVEACEVVAAEVVGDFLELAPRVDAEPELFHAVVVQP